MLEDEVWIPDAYFFKHRLFFFRLFVSVCVEW